MKDSKIILDTVDLVIMDGVNTERTVESILASTEQLQFRKVMLFAPYMLDELSDVVDEFYKFESSYEEWNKFIIKSLHNYIGGTHVLFTHRDGFVLNPKAWRKQFLEYDYIGARWAVPHWNVGNGGFSLRSKKLLQMVSKLNLPTYTPEDWLICHIHGPALAAEGIRFAPQEVADVFSIEGHPDLGRVWQNQFGFHNEDQTDISNWRRKQPTDRIVTRRFGSLECYVRPNLWHNDARIGPEAIDVVIARETIERDCYGLNYLKGTGFAPKTMLDIGSNTGLVSRYATAIWPGLSVTCVDPRHYDVLKLNVPLARVVTASCGEYASWGWEGPFKSSSVVGPKLTAEELIALLPADLVKLDCEGGEQWFFDTVRAVDAFDKIAVIVGEWHGAESFKRILDLRKTHILHFVELAANQDHGIFSARRIAGQPCAADDEDSRVAWETINIGHTLSLLKPDACNVYTSDTDMRCLLSLFSRVSGNYLEIGCNRGLSLMQACYNFPDSVCYGIDSSGDNPLHDRQVTEKPTKYEVGWHVRAFKNARIFDQNTSAFVFSQLDDVVFAFIDSDHTYEGVRTVTEQVIEYFSTFDDGKTRIIAWHDYISKRQAAERHAGAWMGVGAFIRNDMAPKYKCQRLLGTNIVYTEGKVWK